MTARDPNGWADLKVDQLEILEQEDFEDFCFDLVQYEGYDRHDLPEFAGPAPRDVPDGGRDILLSIKKPAHTSKTVYQRTHLLGPLTEDETGRTVYSCKSGDNWLNLALRDVNDRKGPGRAVEVLLEGGHFKLMINKVGKLDEEVKRNNSTASPRAHLAAAFHERLKILKPDAEDPIARIEILDAHAIAGFLRARRPEGGSISRWAGRFDLIPLLGGLDEWRAAHREDRNEPSFVDDPVRSKLRDDLLRFMRSSATDSNARTAWLVGPPGVGKTRLLIQTLSGDPAIAQRVRVAGNPEEAMEALRKGRLLSRHHSVILIVDDCPSISVDSVAAEFRAAANTQPNARLLVMTPAAAHVLNDARISSRWFLEALDANAAQALAAGVLGNPVQGDQQIQDIVRLSERYPWFITLLAREAIAAQRSPSDIREAAKWAIASFREAKPGPELEALRLRRARSLLAASLTRRIDWDALSSSERENVALAVGLSRWPDVKDAALECVKRGILRRNQGWKFKYVTPLVLEREVIAWLLDPDGPDPGGKDLARYGQAYLSDFFETIARLELPRSTLSAIARAGLDDLRGAPMDRGALQAAGILGPRLSFVIRNEPASAGRELHRRIVNLGIDELRARTDERRDIVFALEELATRDSSFEHAEDALLRLAKAENESYGNNATAVWTELFFPELNGTYRSLAARLALLERRLSDPDPSTRRLAIAGARAVLTTHGSRRCCEALDGERPVASADEVVRARVQVWHLLTRCFADPDPEVARHAKQVAAMEVRGALRAGLGAEALELLAANVSSFDDAERVKLREALAAVRVYDETACGPTVVAALKHLEEQLAPDSFRERLRQHVGAWRPVRLREGDEAMDDALAREGLTDDVPILAELDWLTSNEAVRAHVFAFALGRQDEQAILVSALRERARSPGDTWKAKILFARYLGGWKEAGRAAAADSALRNLQGVPEDAESLALAVVEVGATEERLQWLESALRAELIGVPCLAEIGRRRHWLEDVGDDAFERFAGVLLEGASLAQAVAALELLVDQTKERPVRADTLRPLLLRAVERLAAEQLSGMADYYWELGAAFLAESGEAARVASLAVIALSRSSGSSDHAWNTLHLAAQRDPVATWRAVAAALAQRTPEAGRLLVAFMFHRSSFAWPREEVLSWVERDERRGRTVVSLVPRGAEELDPILRALVQRFGPYSSVADEILARMHSTNGLVPSLADHDAQHLEQAREWLKDPDSDVRKFASRLVESLTKSHAYHAAEEEDEHRRWGTA